MNIPTCKCCGTSPPKSYVTRGTYVCKPCKHYFMSPIAMPLPPIHVPDVKGGGIYATAETTRMGTQAEQSFVAFCSAAKYPVRPATLYENTVLHYDFVVHHPKLQFIRVEVKSIKSRRRGLPPDPRVLFIELKDIHGNAGWLYGKADVIAFQQTDGFLFVLRPVLVKFAEGCLPDLRRSYQSGIYHTLYSRPNRQDLMMVLDISDIQHLAIEV